MSAISVKNLSKKFGKFSAVKNISFDVSEKRVVGFLGPNGAGKTTTIRMIVGLSKPTDGSIKISDETIVFGNSSLNNLFGYLPEQPAFYGWMKASEYLSFISKTFGLTDIESKKRIFELLELVNLTDAREKRIATYSNGMKQRLGIAQALINDPKILILDEPVSALDPIGRKDVLHIIQKLKKDKTIFLSTHILSDVDRICDDVVIINHGNIVANSSLADLKKKYAKSILSVEFDSDPSELITRLKSENWVLKAESDDLSAKIWLKDGEAMKNNLPLKFLAKEKIGICSYGIKLPETEDLFLDLVKEDK